MQVHVLIPKENSDTRGSCCPTLWCNSCCVLKMLPLLPSLPSSCLQSPQTTTQKELASMLEHLLSPARQLLQHQLFPGETQPFSLTKAGQVTVPAWGMEQVWGRGLPQGFPDHQICLGRAVVQDVAPLLQVAIQGTNLCWCGEQPQGAQPRLSTESRNPISEPAKLALHCCSPTLQQGASNLRLISLKYLGAKMDIKREKYK